MKPILTKLYIRCNRRVWFIATAVVFLLLGRWRWIEAKGSSFSLFDLLADGLRSLLPHVRTFSGEVLLGLLFMLLLTIAYVAISLFLGWLLAAIISAIIVVSRECNRR